MDVDRLSRIAMNGFAHVYIENNVEEELLLQKFHAWCRKQFAIYDACDLAEGVTVSLTERAWLEVPGYTLKQYGHVFTMLFEDPLLKPEEYKRAQLFLRTSESGKIVELLQFQPTLH
jgi:hypothetical protein